MVRYVILTHPFQVFPKLQAVRVNRGNTQRYSVLRLDKLIDVLGKLNHEFIYIITITLIF